MRDYGILYFYLINLITLAGGWGSGHGRVTDMCNLQMTTTSKDSRGFWYPHLRAVHSVQVSELEAVLDAYPL